MGKGIDFRAFSFSSKKNGRDLKKKIIEGEIYSIPASKANALYLRNGTFSCGYSEKIEKTDAIDGDVFRSKKGIFIRIVSFPLFGLPTFSFPMFTKGDYGCVAWHNPATKEIILTTTIASRSVL